MIHWKKCARKGWAWNTRILLNLSCASPKQNNQIHPFFGWNNQHMTFMKVLAVNLVIIKQKAWSTQYFYSRPIFNHPLSFLLGLNTNSKYFFYDLGWYKLCCVSKTRNNFGPWQKKKFLGRRKSAQVGANRRKSAQVGASRRRSAQVGASRRKSAIFSASPLAPFLGSVGPKYLKHKNEQWKK